MSRLWRIFFNVIFLNYRFLSRTQETSDPSASVPSDIDYIETWRGMEKCKQLGLARSIGVSNFNSEQITRLIANSSIKPVNNQVQFYINISCLSK